MIKRPKLKCPTCVGRGEIPLTDSLYSTLSAVISRKGLTAIEAHAITKDQISVTALNNRLEDLRALGLVERIRDGKRWKYSPVWK